MRMVCIGDEQFPLTLGKSYEVDVIASNMLTGIAKVICDDNIDRILSITRFKLISEIRNEKIDEILNQKSV